MYVFIYGLGLGYLWVEFFLFTFVLWTHIIATHSEVTTNQYKKNNITPLIVSTD